MGELARIPWQAARRRGDGAYAVELVAFSQAASARMLCRTAALAPVPIIPVGLIVGDPDPRPPGSARRQEHPPRICSPRAARRSPSSRRSTRGPLPRPAPERDGEPGRRGHRGPGPRLARARRPRRGRDAAPGLPRLRGVAGRGGRPPTCCSPRQEELAAEQLVDLMARAPRPRGRAGRARRLPDRQVDQRLRRGVQPRHRVPRRRRRSVLSTQWAIPDGATSVLMFMFHHYLMVDRLPAGEALRAGPAVDARPRPGGCRRPCPKCCSTRCTAPAST